MNNKGQSLIIFVILLPIILLIMASIVDIGNFLVEKSKCENEVKSTISYGLKHLDDENIKQKLYDLLDSNIGGKKRINIEGETVKIKVTGPVNSLFTSIIDFDYEIDISYIGYMDNEKIIIKKE